VDGLVLAAAFATSEVTGAATVIAIICHEIPQELGDFVILVKGGFSLQRALKVNVLSGLTAICGAIIGALIVEDVEDVAAWILAFTAGAFLFMFLYIGAMVLTPDATNTKSKDNSFAQNTGFCTGAILTFVLVVME